MSKLICPICNYSSEYRLTTKYSYKVFQCNNENCGHYWLPNPKENQGIHSRNQDLEIESNQNIKLYGERNQRLLKLILRTIPNIRKYNFLDFGSGCAHISRSFKASLGESVDIYCLEANVNCQRFYPEWNLIPVKDLEQINVKIDLIYMIEVIEHLENPREVLLQLKKILKKKSYLFLSTPPGYSDESRTNAFDNPTHIHFFTDKSLNILLESCGFNSIEYKTYSEMYPKPKKQSLRKKIILSCKIYVKNIFLNLTTFFKKGYSKKEIELTYPFHLVGFTTLKE